MTDFEIALRAAANVLRDSVESGRMPSGVALDHDSKALHARAADQLDSLARSLSVDPEAAATAFRRAVVDPAPR